MTTTKLAYVKGFVATLVKRGQSFAELQRRYAYEQQMGQDKPMFDPQESNTAQAVGRAVRSGYASEGDAWRGQALTDPNFASTLAQNPEALRAADQNRPQVLEARLDPKKPAGAPTANTVTPPSTIPPAPAVPPVPATPRALPMPPAVPRQIAYRPPPPIVARAPGRITDPNRMR